MGYPTAFISSQLRLQETFIPSQQNHITLRPGCQINPHVFPTTATVYKLFKHFTHVHVLAKDATKSTSYNAAACMLSTHCDLWKICIIEDKILRKMKAIPSHRGGVMLCTFNTAEYLTKHLICHDSFSLNHI